MATDAELIRDTQAPWKEAALARDWDAMLDMCTDDMVFMPPGEPSVSGDDLRPWLESFPVIREFDTDFEDVVVSGELAVASGSVRMSLEIDGERVPFDGKFTDVFRKGADGTWRYRRVIWNSNRETA